MIEAVIGLEVHVALNTESKLFCSCSTRFGAEANTQVCPACLGMPGIMPVLNKKAVDKAILASLSLDCTIARLGGFDRKNYFYPDMPKSYQISQVFDPIGQEGTLEIDTPDGKKKIRIRQIHLEEDAGKLVHEGDSITSAKGSLVDLNRAGAPLIEIVSHPDIRNADEAVSYLENLRAILRYGDVSECRMEEGSFRCDGNISVREAGSDVFNPKVEIKNMNSMKALHKALMYEIKRQSEMLKQGKRVDQETRTWDEQKEITLSMRSKEFPDYRVYPEPELGYIEVSDEWLTEIRTKVPELPQAKKQRYMTAWDLSEYDAHQLSREQDLARYFEETVELYPEPKKISNWIQAELMRLLNNDQKGISESPVQPQHLAQLIQKLDQGVISGKMAKEVLEGMYAEEKDAETIIHSRGLSQISDDTELETVAGQIIADNPKPVADYRGGKTKAMGFLVGQMMKATRGQANPDKANDILKKLLDN
jgi:aspartyl-tRNA(Asn)/glutamyl-tRNA(Gln) amidotransferase subunit B